MKKWVKSILNALKGIHIVLMEERNFRIMVLLGVLSLLLAFLLELSVVEWIIVIIINGLVLFAEMTNTAIERITDMKANDKRIKKMKDISSGAVFILTVMAFVVGLIIFLPKILELFLI